jgi:CBS domain-containing protein
MKKCREVMTKDPVCCAATDSVDKVAKAMKKQDVGSIPIVDDCTTRRLVGIITDRDLAVQIVAEGRDAGLLRAADVMTRSPVTCRADDDLQVAIDAMEKHQVRRIPIVDENRTLIGIVAQADLATRSNAPEKTAEVVEEISRPSVMRAG